jgi:hypothetical protein
VTTPPLGRRLYASVMGPIRGDTLASLRRHRLVCR